MRLGVTGMFRFTFRVLRAAVVAAGLCGGAASAQDLLPPIETGSAAPMAPPTMVEERSPVAPPTVSEECECKDAFDWKKVPRVRPLPRPGNFSVTSTGPGY